MRPIPDSRLQIANPIIYKQIPVWTEKKWRKVVFFAEKLAHFVYFSQSKHTSLRKNPIFRRFIPTAWSVACLLHQNSTGFEPTPTATSARWDRVLQHQHHRVNLIFLQGQRPTSLAGFKVLNQDQSHPVIFDLDLQNEMMLVNMKEVGMKMEKSTGKE
jgi:hypothetical protein